MTDKEMKILKELKEKLKKECPSSYNEVKDSDILLMYKEYMSNNYGVEHSKKIFKTNIYKNHGCEYCIMLQILHWDYVPQLKEMKSFREAANFCVDIMNTGKIPKGFSPSDIYIFRDCLKDIEKTNYAEFIQDSVKKLFEKCGINVAPKGIGFKVVG